MRKICTSCHKEFMLIGEENFSVCEICRQNARNYRSRQTHVKRVEEDMPKSNLDKKIREIQAYNKEHGTHYSYGKYMALKERGLI